MAPSKRALPIVLASTLAVLAGCPDRPLDRGAELEAKGQLTEAGELYVELVKRDPANLPAWDRAVDVWCRKKVDVGQCMNVLDLELDKLGNLERHHDALAEVLELRARARIEQGIVDAALSDLDRATKASPKRASLYTARARALIHVGRRDDAVTALKRAKELDATSPEIEELLKLLPGDTADTDGFGGTSTTAKD
ncbi:tetratricopeptide repeat protein [Myxococcota bacterium]|nr:tetratricopeptide repeat protein [Myxococcota bacterium]